jgi:hypothetical protein
VIKSPLKLSRENSLEGLKADMAAFGVGLQSYLSRHPALWRNWRILRLLDLMQPDKERTPNLAQISF